jgi:hypothetical protein
MSVQRAAFTRMVNAQCELSPDIFERGCDTIVTHTQLSVPQREDRLVGEQKSSPFRRGVASSFKRLCRIDRCANLRVVEL